MSVFLKGAADPTFLEPFAKGGLDVPRPVKTAQNPNGLCSDEIINLILKYIYNNQDFQVIKGQLNDANIKQMYSQAYMMKCPNLLNNLQEMIINELLNPDNATSFYVDAILVSAFIHSAHLINLFI